MNPSSATHAPLSVRGSYIPAGQSSSLDRDRYRLDTEFKLVRSAAETEEVSDGLHDKTGLVHTDLFAWFPVPSTARHNRR
ncbi:hypothetical protein [Rhodococcus wratislaviensis]|uniref:Uncharacterized protein n=1 Tax=Rhodococcus wratislaviensis NBRC 100605 TaxID=1219028 RepID=X0PZ68_RHOWR|nr:hypothetical protein [Rhodococcus wratislaviensis]GAF43772.1 hypothetical protein RW1_009_01970 [Rhodococcus wratislaviensis NBRC 100605]